MEIVAGLITLLGLALGIWKFYASRKRAPTTQERLDDVDREFSDSIENVHRLREKGEHARADAMFRRLALRASGGVREPQQ